MSIGIKGKRVIAYDGKEHRLLRDGVVVTEGQRIKHVDKSYAGRVNKWTRSDTAWATFRERLHTRDNKPRMKDTPHN